MVTAESFAARLDELNARWFWAVEPWADTTHFRNHGRPRWVLDYIDMVLDHA